MFSDKRLALFLATLHFGTTLGQGVITQLDGNISKNGFGVSSFNTTNVDESQVFSNNSGCGNINITDAIEQAILTQTFAIASSNETLNMVWRQISAENEEGGSITALVDDTGTGENFQATNVTQNLQILGDDQEEADIPISVQLPIGFNCTGGADHLTCLGRVESLTSAGSSGSCFAFKTFDISTGAGSNDTLGIGPLVPGEDPANLTDIENSFFLDEHKNPPSR